MVMQQPQKEMMKQPFTGQALAEWRERLAYSVTDAANELGCSEQSIRNWESGESTPPKYIGIACDFLALGLTSQWS